NRAEVLGRVDTPKLVVVVPLGRRDLSTLSQAAVQQHVRGVVNLAVAKWLLVDKVSKVCFALAIPILLFSGRDASLRTWQLILLGEREVYFRLGNHPRHEPPLFLVQRWRDEEEQLQCGLPVTLTHD